MNSDINPRDICKRSAIISNHITRHDSLLQNVTEYGVKHPQAPTLNVLSVRHERPSVRLSLRRQNIGQNGASVPGLIRKL